MNEPLIGNIPGTHDWAGRPMKGDRYRANYDAIFRKRDKRGLCDKRDKRDLSTKRMIIDQKGGKKYDESPTANLTGRLD